ncbi:zinc finger and BTB domain-containing protein 25-like [Coregonus clupeaformis]|uniref:zinc finger and BTB domain-containing protein 25-like n=1 Tax=Coregonus clupeaformis TaxID=59861 RepID=UPI001BDF79DE|nr:zinc finger and BTB domain-containing protein 25-like [Coregonus clupeaformis]XP_041716928.1 zinc finger and BTB domain-containing protein 25-like [Coregonus clupeaformis]
MDVSSHSLFLLQQLNIQREFGFLCDCTVAIGNVYFKAHRAILAAFSNYFKMIFIHQSSECIKIQPTDIQPDVFSYLLHIMYTGMGPKQPVDQGRLQEGIKFLHAYQLCRIPDEGSPDATDLVRMSNLYGIQISSQLANKEGTGGPKGSAGTGGGGSPEDGRSSTRAGRSHAAQFSMTVGLEGVPSSDRQPFSGLLRGVSSVASGDDSDISTRIKQERVEEGEGEGGEGQQALGRGGSPMSPSAQGGSPCQSLLFKDGPLSLLCPRCGERCPSPEGLRKHLFSHAACTLDPSGLMEGLSQGGVGDLEGPENQQQCGAPQDQLEEALRQSQALADELAAGLRQSRGGLASGTSPPPTTTISTTSHARKRKITCAVCSLRFAQKSQLQEHMYTHTGKPSRYHRYSRLCSQLIHASGHFCEGPPEGGGGGVGVAASTTVMLTEEANREAQDNGSSCYSLDSEISPESVDAVTVE